jgi:L-2-hydroxyglutarate oxidase LhgO
MKYDCLVIGAGLVGLATAYQILSESPHLKVIICDKEKKPAFHQSGRNSGVVHSGVYYKPGSLKAKNCIEGKEELLRFCAGKVSFREIHKVILARTPREEAYLLELESRAKANGIVDAELIGPEKLAEIEPHASATKALYLPSCQIIDYLAVAEELCKEIKAMGGEIVFGEEIREFKDDCVISSKSQYQCKIVINCAGLHSDRIAKACLGSAEHQILPFRGEYYLLKEERRSLVKGLIYPVPDPKSPFLGVHLTPMINGNVEAGPNAILATAREGYRRSDLNLRDFGEVLAYPGFWKMASRYWKAGAYEMIRSTSKRLFVRDVQQLVPAIQEKDLIPGGAGIRAQVVKRNGMLMDDFCIREDQNSIHVVNAPSPAATACLAIGRTIAAKAIERLQ